jgi:DNA (cytosine-5)-methyltransferase 1
MEDIDFSVACETLLGTGSPECTFHSPSAGEALDDQNQLPIWTDHDKKPHIEQSRMSMWQVYRAAAARAKIERPYHSMIFENVPEVASKWGGYQSWRTCMQALGYEFQAVYLCAMFFGVCQRRDRWFGIFWRKGAKRPELEFRPLATCQYCEREVRAIQCFKNPAKKWGKYDYSGYGQYTYNCPQCAKRVQPYYQPASTILDTNDRGIRIGERRAYGLPPLENATMQRIQSGIERFIKHPQVAPAGAKDISAQESQALPFWITYYSNGKPYSIYEPFCTFSTVARVGVVFPPASGSFDINEYSFRMLNEREILAGSGLPDGRMISIEEAKKSSTQGGYEVVADTKGELIRQCGHMVPPGMGLWVARQVLTALTST